MIKLIAVLFLLPLLSSCDPGYAVVLSNKSLMDKEIKVLVTDKNRFAYLDSIAIVDTVNPPKRTMIAIAKDTQTNSYSFKLAAGKNAVLEQGIGGPDLSEKIIVDSYDTISLATDKRVTKKKEGISTSIAVRIE